MVRAGARESLRTPRVSVIIPAYQVAPFIREALDSVSSQTVTDHEVIVINDGSPDTPDLEKALQPYAAQIRYLRQVNSGPSAARNSGLAIARAPYVAFLDGDDRWEPNALEAHLTALEADPSLGYHFANGVLFGEGTLSGSEIFAAVRMEAPIGISALLRGASSVLMGGVARRAAVDAAGGFDPSIRTSEDFDLWIRMLKTGWRIGYTQERLQRRRLRAGSLSANRARMERGVLLVLEKLSSVLDFTAGERAALEEQALHRRSLLELELGREELQAGDFGAARVHLVSANRGLRRMKLSLALGLMKIAPGIVRRLAVCEPEELDMRNSVKGGKP